MNKDKTHKRVFTLSRIAVLISTLLSVDSALAQEQTGVLAGKVVGVQGVNPIEGAKLTIKELGRETSSLSDGSFRIGSLPPGDYTLILDYLGADEQAIVVTVKSGETVRQPLQLQGDSIEIIEVSSNYAGLNSARNMQRVADTVKDIIDSNAAGQFADQTVAESLQRLPGVNIDRSDGEGRFVTIRGLGPEFNSVSINGVTIGSSSSGFGLTGSAPSRAVALDLVPSDLLETIEVSKTRTAAMDGDSIGGSIDLRALSAYDKGGYSLRFKAEGSYNEQAEETSPRGSIKFTDFLDDEKKWGIALAGSYSNQKVEGDSLRNGNGLVYRRSFVDPVTLLEIEDEDLRPEFLRIEEIDQRREISERERYGYSVNIDYRPNDDSQYYVRFLGSQLSDTNINLRQEWEIRDAGTTDNENLLLQRNSGLTTDADLEKLTNFSDSEENVNTFSIGGKNFLENWVIDYQAAYSKNEFDRWGVRSRFRERDNAIRWQITSPYTVVVEPFFGDPDSPPLSEASSSDIRGDISELSNFEFDSILYSQDRSQDVVSSFTFNATRDIEIGDMFGELKMGVKSRIRDKSNDRVEEFSTDPTDNPDVFSQQVLSDWDLFTPTSNLNSVNLGYFPENSQLRDFLFSNIDLFRSLRDINTTAVSNTVRGDYESEENILAAYVMATIDVSDELRIISGIRVEQTKFNGDAFRSRRIDIGGDLDEVFEDSLQDLTQVNTEKKYTDVLPSLHVRYEPNEDVIVRASYTQAVQRPSFFANLPREDIVVEIDGDDLDDFEVVVEIEAGNPELEAANASQFDASIAWYPNDLTYFSIGVFYKDIDNFFARAIIRDTSAISALGYTGGDIQITDVDGNLVTFDGTYDVLEITLNGDSATVSGIEMSYSQKFLNGFFIDTNLAFMDSEANLGEPRPDEKLALPDQADGTANISIGWENDKLSLRTSWNWRDEILSEVSDDPISDQIREAYGSIDINIKYKFADNYRIYFAATNITEEEDVSVYRGDESTGRLFEKIEQWGTTYRLGISGSF